MFPVYYGVGLPLQMTFLLDQTGLEALRWFQLGSKRGKEGFCGHHRIMQSLICHECWNGLYRLLQSIAARGKIDAVPSMT